MPGKPKKHPVDGGWMTVQQAADMLGITCQQIYHLMSKHKIGLQVVVNMVRNNLVLNGQGRSERHMVDGRWMTTNQAADMLGIKPYALRQYRRQHPDAQGNPATLQRAVDAYRQGVHRGGGKWKVHKVNGRPMTVAQAAERLGIQVQAVRNMMSRKKWNLATTVRYYEKKKRRKAEKAIMNILGY